MPLSTFFLGSSLVSLTLAPWIFPQWGRKVGFFTGIALGLVGTALGALSVALSSPGLYILSTFFFGGATGLGFALRFAAVEVVPAHFSSRAVTLVVSGGVIAAFAGPESAAATRDLFDQDGLTYLGVFLMTGIFNICNLLATALVTFPPPKQRQQQQHQRRPGGDNGEKTSFVSRENTKEICQLVGRRQFWVPMLVASGAWAAMGMPMSLVRVAMGDLGYTTTDSLRVVELHFLGMYAPGFFTGNLIKWLGAPVVCYLGVALFAVAQVVAFMQDQDESDFIWLWAAGLALVGIAWNFCFTASTVWLMQKGPADRKSTLQASNDFLMFLIAGAWLFASSYIYDAGSSNDDDGLLDGWYTLNWVVVGIIGCLTVLLFGDVLLDRIEQSKERRRDMDAD